MKTIYILLIASLALLASSCEKKPMMETLKVCGR